MVSKTDPWLAAFKAFILMTWNPFAPSEIEGAK